jgi:hypothetical protein
MSSKQTKLLCKIYGCVTLLLIGGVFVAGLRYGQIVNQFGIDAPFEDFTSIQFLSNVWYGLNDIHETIRDAITIFEDGSFRGCIPGMLCD